jgi:hypothetical protein
MIRKTLPYDMFSATKSMTPKGSSATRLSGIGHRDRIVLRLLTCDLNAT